MSAVSDEHIVLVSNVKKMLGEKMERDSICAVLGISRELFAEIIEIIIEEMEYLGEAEEVPVEKKRPVFDRKEWIWRY